MTALLDFKYLNFLVSAFYVVEANQIYSFWPSSCQLVAFDELEFCLMFSSSLFQLICDAIPAFLFASKRRNLLIF